jgi:hypothetical protein
MLGLLKGPTERIRLVAGFSAFYKEVVLVAPKLGLLFFGLSVSEKQSFRTLIEQTSIPNLFNSGASYKRV